MVGGSARTVRAFHRHMRTVTGLALVVTVYKPVAKRTARHVIGGRLRNRRSSGAADVCLATWCNLDYALGEMTNQKLVRTKTIAQDDGKCDFRILPMIQP